MASNPGAGRRTASNKAVLALPKDWRTDLPKRVGKLPFTGLSGAVGSASAILEGRSDAEVQQFTNGLLQLIAEYPPTTVTLEGVPYVPDVDPHLIYILHANANLGTGTLAHHLAGGLAEHLAIATLLAVARACDAFANAHDLLHGINTVVAIAINSCSLLIACPVVVFAKGTRDLAPSLRKVHQQWPQKNRVALTKTKHQPPRQLLQDGRVAH